MKSLSILIVFVFIFLLVIFVAIFTTFDSNQDHGDTTECAINGNISQCVFHRNHMTVNLGSNSSLQLTLNSGKIVMCNITATEDGWYGEQCGGNARDANIILHKDHHGMDKIFGSIHIGPDICAIKPNADGEEDMACTPEADMPPVGEAIIPSFNNSEEYDAHIRSLHVGFDPKHSIDGATDEHGRLLYDDSGSNIDVMVVWTNDAECQNSFLPAGCRLTATTESNMRGVIDLLVAETNTAFTLSGMLSSLRLVHAYRDSTYVEPPNADLYGPNEPILVAINDLTGTTDGKLDGVHAMRALYGADMVQLIIGQFSFCGRGWLSTRREFAFSVISSVCTTGAFAYAHEIGHNFEMNHDRGTKGSCNATGYNFGYRSPTASLRTIMAYDCRVGQCDNMPKNGCISPLRFSNTQYRYNGEPLGNARNNNALQFNNFRALVASNFPAMNCQNSGQCNDNNENTIDTCNIAKAVCVFTPRPTPRPVASPSAPRPRPVSSPGAPRPRPVTSPSAPRPISSPGAPRPRPVSSPSAPRPRPVSSPGAPRPRPVSSPSAPRPVSRPSAPRPLSRPSAPGPVSSPNAPKPQPVTSPGAPRPRPVPNSIAPIPEASPNAPRPVTGPIAP